MTKTVTVTVTELLQLHPLLEDRGRITKVNPYPGVRGQDETEMFSDHVETSPSITASVSAPSIACSMLAVQQQKRLCRQFAWNIGNRCQKV